jgi:two-component system OmpR family sensor kinase
VLSIVGLVTLFAVAVGVLSVSQLHRDLSDRLDDRVVQLVKSPYLNDADDHGAQFETLAIQLLPDGTIVRAEFTDAEGTSTDLTADQVREVLAAVVNLDLGECATANVDDIGEVRVVAAHTPSDTVAIAGIPTTEIVTTTWGLALIYGLVALIAIVLVGAGASALVARQLRPLERVASTAVRVSQKELAAGEVAIPERVPTEYTDPETEVGRVGASLNRLLASVEGALASREASEAKLRQFVADASHELRTPLAAVSGYAELAAREPERLSEQQRTSLTRIRGASQRMTTLVEDLLQLARLDAGQEQRRVPLDVNELALGCFEDALAAYPTHEWSFDAAAADDEPERLEVLGDPGTLTQVLGNLLRNAAVHTEAGTSVTLATGRDAQGRVCLTVADTGGGIDPEVAPHIFERFVRGDTSRTGSLSQGSSGLGLAISQAIVQAHGGTLEVASRPGSTVFTVTLPAA